MIRPINHDQNFLKQKAQLATKNDLPIVQDLQDTLKANSKNCVGMAANMIGQNKKIIIFSLGMMAVVMINPTIISKKNSYVTFEGCLSLEGQRQTTRFKEITVKYLDTDFHEHIQEFSDFIAQIIQHEIDHCDGILI
ncbi:peptide deformylase [Companilactobacillus alimentarius]|uniref:Peptide deformylase n=1 Tax=Companilactobacillus alimentarius DSM 20249 TaxID=1423720 RepID=A0A2K9HJ32_9LACO|nr:peptide deformylase [Companilactobacillus alimentarius]AUI72554.1 peptide deformylase [Companilactobacillus alimentarius DSM 20249]KRK77675.1 peptide deformylase [Companilactobacillus alimentarius DSM 20249]MDT6953150.1 peptide deformylase [Companilactobacillus alimentarius]GEO45088.1 peptide deformylase [Companilactobacillus alimentarius]